MTDLPAPRANRLQRPSWRDTRLLVGVLLVLASVALGALVVAHADDRTPMYAARTPLVPGQRLTAADLSRVDVRLGGQERRYLSAATGLAPDRFVLRAVPAGELVPAAAVGGRDRVGVQPLVVTVDAGAAATLQVGSRVDVYVDRLDPGAGAAAAGTGGRGFLGPELTLESVVVSSLPRGAGGLGGGSSGDRAVQVMAPTSRIKEVIGAVDLGARVTVVPVPGSPLRVEQ